jgi:hypothetical protein
MTKVNDDPTEGALSLPKEFFLQKATKKTKFLGRIGNLLLPSLSSVQNLTHVGFFGTRSGRLPERRLLARMLSE